MLRKRKSNKSVKIPKPIKREKLEEDRTPQPMSHYVNDRLELMKQIFGTLKPKTITNLAPDFLKKKDLDSIQELCLNELLGISTKRLLSIINDKQCPSDTDTSGDSDVHNIEEHVSLEEISSDSEIGDGIKKARKNKTTGGVNKISSKKNPSKTAGEKNGHDGQISVLELLELQARARAIRSQLALEPVTKIEVNSDGESGEIASARSKESRSSNRKERKRKSSEQLITTTSNKKESRISSKQITLNGIADKSSSKTDKADSDKKIKLKRNFRTNKQTTNEVEKIHEEVRKPNGIKEEKGSRSASPDVIPIVSEPVTLMIGDTSDEDDVAQKLPVLEISAATQPNEVQVNKVTEGEHLSCNREPEDGEIIDETESTSQKDGHTSASTAASDNVDVVDNEKNDEVLAENMDEKTSNVPEDENTDGNEFIKTTSPAPVTDDESKTTELQVTESDRESKDIQENNPEASNQPPPVESVAEEYDDDQNDDIISIEGGDLENEMSEHLEDNSQPYRIATCDKVNGTNMEPANNSRKLCEDDVISLDSSEDESTKESTESWNSRWLKSSKVSKVLAISRLGKRVRDNIKKTKRPQIESKRDDNKAIALTEAMLYTSKHEDGSIEQYKELLEMRHQRKNSESKSK